MSVSPFVRHYLFSDNTVRVFCDYTAGYGYNGQAESRNGFEVGVKPGIALSLTEKINVITHIGFLGYRQDFCGLESGYGLKLNTEDDSKYNEGDITPAYNVVPSFDLDNISYEYGV